MAGVLSRVYWRRWHAIKRNSPFVLSCSYRASVAFELRFVGKKTYIRVVKFVLVVLFVWHFHGIFPEVTVRIISKRASSLSVVSFWQTFQTNNFRSTLSTPLSTDKLLGTWFMTIKPDLFGICACYTCLVSSRQPVAEFVTIKNFSLSFNLLKAEISKHL